MTVDGGTSGSAIAASWSWGCERALVSRTQHGSLAEGAHGAPVDRQPAGLVVILDGLRVPRGEFAGVDAQFADPAGQVDVDGVAVPDEGQRTAVGGFGPDLADDDAAVDEPGQLAVGDHRDCAGEPGAVEGEDDL